MLFPMVCKLRERAFFILECFLGTVFHSLLFNLLVIDSFGFFFRG